MKHFSKTVLPDKPWQKYRKTHLTEAIRIAGPFTVATKEGVLDCFDGYLAVDTSGWPYPIDYNEFQRMYEVVK